MNTKPHAIRDSQGHPLDCPCPRLPDWELKFSQREGSQMSRELRRHFAAEFKEQAIARLSEPGASQISVARELGVTPSQLRGWRLEMAAAGSAEAIRRQQAEAAELAE